MQQDPFLEIFILAERLHRQFLEVIQSQLDALKIRDINNVRALILLNIGESEMTASELLWRGCYLGSNVSYNLKKLTESGYVVQTRSDHDRRVIMVRNSEKGAQLRAKLQEMNARHLDTIRDGSMNREELAKCGKTLRSLQQLWSRIGEATPGMATNRQASVNGAQADQAMTSVFSGRRDVDEPSLDTRGPAVGLHTLSNGALEAHAARVV